MTWPRESFYGLDLPSNLMDRAFCQCTRHSSGWGSHSPTFFTHAGVQVFTHAGVQVFGCGSHSPTFFTHAGVQVFGCGYVDVMIYCKFFVRLKQKYHLGTTG